ncbi:hypothetical protein [Actinomadura verrucosospora]|uniref:Uncharacterized protein n=1 Tax=Actinomadura verrucosospora TaxID=46165 RepID=A0A7D3VSI0_ACTVE|nr:hypothetical protein [Actinomadura verrucosospora]QKG18976.1 hypothetical protein ACTIVE_0612 [Actinomadura verrucosospora]
MPKLNQIIAVEKGAKSRAQREIAEIGQRLQKTALLSGISRTYQPLDDDGESLPPESTRVQVTAEGTLKEVATALTRLFDITATKDWANCDARADVVVDGRTVLEQVPVAHLLFLEKQLTELAGLVDRLPVLDTAEAWTFDESADVWRTEPVRTTRTKKIPRAHVLYEATTEHPAQVETYTEDVIVGTWTRTAFSGALPARRVNELRERVAKLQAAIKFAREEANGAEVTDRKVGEAVFGYLFA